MKTRRWREHGNRLRVMRSALDATEQKAADVCGVTPRRYRRCEHRAREQSVRAVRKSVRPPDVSFARLFDSGGAVNGEHLGRKATGEAAMLPVVGPNFRRCQRRPIEMVGQGRGHR